MIDFILDFCLLSCIAFYALCYSIVVTCNVNRVHYGLALHLCISEWAEEAQIPSSPSLPRCRRGSIGLESQNEASASWYTSLGSWHIGWGSWLQVLEFKKRSQYTFIYCDRIQQFKWPRSPEFWQKQSKRTEMPNLQIYRWKTSRWFGHDAPVKRCERLTLGVTRRGKSKSKKYWGRWLNRIWLNFISPKTWP